MKEKEIVILGAGLVGSLLSIYLQRAGFKVTIYEKRPDPRKQNIYAGRSINLAMSTRGLKALEAVGLKDQVLKCVVPMAGRQMHGTDGSLTFQPYGKSGQQINAVSRALLNKLLVEKAESIGVEVLFDHRCDDVDLQNGSATIYYNGSSVQIGAELIVGADGAFSAMRQAMLRTDRFNYAQQFIEHGYKEFSIPAIDGGYAMPPNALHIWPRGNFMMIALPNLDYSFTCTLFFPFEGSPSFGSIQSDADIEDFFAKYFPDLPGLMPDYISQYRQNPQSSLVTVKCYPWAHGRCLLIGDASHAIVPFYGQGMNAGFEDCFIFDEMAKAVRYDWDILLPKFQQERKQDTDAIADLALQNFVEMRDKVADARFLFQKKLEAKLHELFPDEWIPQYSMVTFSDSPYSEALRKGKIQHDIIQKYITVETMAKPGQVDFEKVIKELRSLDNTKTFG